MHKFFAKTWFLGKKVIFLPECHSTNDYLSNLLRSSKIPDGTIVWTDYQSSGKGQRGNQWQSVKGENILASIIIRLPWLSIKDQFLLPFSIGLAIRDCLQQYVDIPVKVKWPNDIYLSNRKICGILCETSLSGSSIEHAVVGFGININQMKMDHPFATSLKLITDREYNREKVLEEVIVSLEKWLLILKSSTGKEKILEAYHSNLYGINEIKTFQADGQFDGIIKGVDDRGDLCIFFVNYFKHPELNQTIKSFGLKEISMIR